MIKTWGVVFTCTEFKKKKGAIDTAKERGLNKIGFIWNVFEGKWDTMIMALIQLEQRKGHCNVVYKHIEHMDDGVKVKLGV
jgi:hypothetical protein